MVVACTILALNVVCVNILTYRLWSSKIKWSALHAVNRSKRNGSIIDWNIVVSIDFANQVVNSWSRVCNTCQSKEAVVCHVDDGFLVCETDVVNHEVAIICPSVSHLHIELARETFFHVGSHIVKFYCILCNLLCIPHTSMETCRSSVQSVWSIVDGKAVLFSIKSEFSLANTVAIASDKGRKKWFWTGDYIVDVVVTLYHVCNISISVWNHYSYKCSTIVCYCNFVACFVCQDVEVCLLSVNHFLEICSLQSRKIVLNCAHFYYTII